MALRFGRKLINSLRKGIAVVMSDFLTARIFSSLPTYHGTMFQRSVVVRGSPAASSKVHIFLAEGSGLFREIKLLPIALRPGASRRKSTSE